MWRSEGYQLVRRSDPAFVGGRSMVNCSNLLRGSLRATGAQEKAPEGNLIRGLDAHESVDYR